MTDLTKGIIEINGFTFKPGTKIDDVLAFFGDKVRVLELSTGPRVKLAKPFYITDGIYAYNFDFSSNGKLQRFGLCPVAPPELDGKYNEIARYALTTSKRWLKSTIKENPTTDCEEGISYHIEGVHISAFVRTDVHYGLVGGEVVVRFDVEE